MMNRYGAGLVLSVSRVRGPEVSGSDVLVVPTDSLPGLPTWEKHEVPVVFVETQLNRFKPQIESKMFDSNNCLDI